MKFQKITHLFSVLALIFSVSANAKTTGASLYADLKTVLKDYDIANGSVTGASEKCSLDFFLATNDPTATRLSRLVILFNHPQLSMSSISMEAALDSNVSGLIKTQRQIEIVKIEESPVPLADKIEIKFDQFGLFVIGTQRHLDGNNQPKTTRALCSFSRLK